jgi:hypothetical protein
MSHEERAGAMTKQEIVALLVDHDDLTRQLAWLKQQVFGSKSERRVVEPDAHQLTLGERSESTVRSEDSTTVAEHSRRKHPRSGADEKTSEPLRFDPSVPVEEIHVAPPALDQDHEVIGEKISYRWAQRPGSYVVLKSIRPVIKLKSEADVSLLASMVIDTFVYQLPL